VLLDFFVLVMMEDGDWRTGESWVKEQESATRVSGIKFDPAGDVDTQLSNIATLVTKKIAERMPRAAQS
jgi:hypothetical protein